MWDAEELAEMRADKEALFVQLGKVFRLIGVDDGQGGEEVTPTQMGEYPCLVSRLRGGQELPEGDRVSPTSDMIIEFPYNTDVSEADRLTVDGVTYEVTATDKGKPNPVELVCYVVKKG